MAILVAIGSGVFGWRGSNFSFFINFQRRLYNTLTLPCQRVTVSAADAML